MEHNMPITITYLIFAHNNAEFLLNLIEQLSYPHCSFYIHNEGNIYDKVNKIPRNGLRRIWNCGQEPAYGTNSRANSTLRLVSSPLRTLPRYILKDTYSR